MSEVNQNGNGLSTQSDDVKTISVRFLSDVEKQFAAQLGQGPRFGEFEKRLTQHMYICVDQALKEAEAKRQKKLNAKELENADEHKRAYSWFSIDRQKLAIDTVHRVNLGLDALLKNHVSPRMYWNSKKEMYDVTLGIGYDGKDFIARKYAADPVLDIRYKLIHEGDTFEALFADADNPYDTYRYKPKDVTNPSMKVVAGYGYIVREDPRKNRLVVVTTRDFERSEKAGGDEFWRGNPWEMRYKTIVHRTTDKVPLDPTKVHAASLAAIQADETLADPLTAEIVTNANQLPVDVAAPPTIDADPPRPSATAVEELTEEDKAEALRREAAEGELFERAQSQARRGPAY